MRVSEFLGILQTIGVIKKVPKVLKDSAVRVNGYIPGISILQSQRGDPGILKLTVQELADNLDNRESIKLQEIVRTEIRNALTDVKMVVQWPGEED